MPFTLTQFRSTRPYLYHLTSQRNLKRLLNCGIIYSTAELLRVANNEEWLAKKRTQTVTVMVNGEEVDLRDQQPLYPGKTCLEGGWSFDDLVRQLNERVFFWPGWDDKPISYGERHFERYASDNPAIIRVKTADLFEENHDKRPHFSKYNSGSPRTTQGKGSPRGPNTFVECASASYTASKVVEVTFVKLVKLPTVIEFAKNPRGRWQSHRG